MFVNCRFGFQPTLATCDNLCDLRGWQGSSGDHDSCDHDSGQYCGDHSSGHYCGDISSGDHDSGHYRADHSSGDHDSGHYCADHSSGGHNSCNPGGHLLGPCCPRPPG